jgi:hypothetical protein
MPENDELKNELEQLLKEAESVDSNVPSGTQGGPMNSVDSLIAPARSGSMTIDLSGEVTLDVKLNVGNQTVYISCDHDNLLVQLGDGTSFRIPFSHPTELKRVA